MAPNLTRGGLTPGKVTNLSTNDEAKFMFNPYEYTISKHNSWDTKPVMGHNIPLVVFKHGDAQSLSLTLYFDSQDTGGDVRQFTETLWKMMMVDETVMDTDSDKSAPPPVAFEWGRLYFKAIITDLSEKFTLFAADGTPLRCTVTLTLQQYIEASEYAPQVAGEALGTSSPPPTTMVQGERLDNVANSTTGSPSNWRSVAQTNNIDNPLNVPAGQQLNTPS
jgi:hypothetical protein